MKAQPKKAEVCVLIGFSISLTGESVKMATFPKVNTTDSFQIET